jgi:hypothetical protein
VQVGAGVSIHNNTFKEILGKAGDITSSAHPDMVQDQGNYTKVYDNDFDDVGDSNFDFDAFSDPNISNIWIYNNVFHIDSALDSYPDQIRVYDSNGNDQIASINDFMVMNNLFADAGGSNIPPVNICYYETCSSATGSGNTFTNNIWVNEANRNDNILYVGTSGPAWTVSNNVYNGPSGATIRWTDGSTYTPANFINEFDPAGHSLVPAFVSYAADSASDDFHLAGEDTVATNTGSNLSADFTTDKDGLARPQTGPWDIGPYQR